MLGEAAIPAISGLFWISRANGGASYMCLEITAALSHGLMEKTGPVVCGSPCHERVILPWLARIGKILRRGAG